MRWASASASCHSWQQRRRRAALHGLLKRGQPSFQRSVLGFERLHLCALRSLQLLDFRLRAATCGAVCSLRCAKSCISPSCSASSSASRPRAYPPGANRVGRGTDLLARRQRREAPAAVGSHRDLHEPVGAGERVGAEVERHREEAAADRHSRNGLCRTNLRPARRAVEERKAQVVTRVCRSAGVGQLALIGEGGGLLRKSRPCRQANKNQVDGNVLYTSFLSHSFSP